MKIIFAVIVTIVCAIIGAFWAFTLNCRIVYGLAGGLIIGIPIGLSANFLFETISKMSNTGSKVIGVLVMFPALILLLLSGTAVGLIMWLIRYVFF